LSLLLDTNVISELVAPRPETRVLTWFKDANEDALHISVVSIAEIRRGIEIMATGRRRELLDAWSTNDLPARFDGRVLNVDASVATAWGAVSARRKAMGRAITTMDAFIAATALCRGLTLVTRNVADFQGLGLTVLNPWEGAA
jgi:predicted nucleic acid-binding protein